MHLRHEPRRCRRLPRPLLLERLEERCLLSYSITDLGTLPGIPVSGAEGVNASGQVVGGGGGGNAFLWDSTYGIQDLGSLAAHGSDAGGINASSQVVGTSNVAGLDVHAFLWDSVNGMQDLGTLGGARSQALGINDSGQVVGYADLVGDFPGHAFLWDSSGGMQDLGTLPGDGNSSAYGINASGQVVGESATPGNFFFHAFLWDSGGGMQDLGNLPGAKSSNAYGINASGQVVGRSIFSDGTEHAFLWDSSGGMQDLGTPAGAVSSEAFGINAFGQVVGASEQPGLFRAFLWDNTGGMQNLDDLLPEGAGWSLVYAAGINDAGQIVGQGKNPSGQYHAYLLTPDGGAAPRGRMKSSAVIDPAVVQVLASFASHDNPGFSGSVSLFQNVQADPVPPEIVNPMHGEPTLPDCAGLIPQRASPQRQAQDVLFAAGDVTQPAGPLSGWELDLLALALSQPE